jgi:hypothetical protein
MLVVEAVKKSANELLGGARSLRPSRAIPARMILPETRCLASTDAVQTRPQFSKSQSIIDDSVLCWLVPDSPTGDALPQYQNLAPARAAMNTCSEAGAKETNASGPLPTPLQIALWVSNMVVHNEAASHR